MAESRNSRVALRVVIGGLIVAALGYGIWKLLETLQSNEPPIRVRGGSMHFDLVTNGSQVWNQDDNAGKEWSP